MLCTHCSHNPRLDYLRHIFFELTSHELDLVLLAWVFATVSLIKEIIRAERNWAAQTPCAPFEYMRHSLRQSLGLSLSLSLSLSLRHAWSRFGNSICWEDAKQAPHKSLRSPLMRRSCQFTAVPRPYTHAHTQTHTRYSCGALFGHQLNSAIDQLINGNCSVHNVHGPNNSNSDNKSKNILFVINKQCKN